jgi:hypothetical protein
MTGGHITDRLSDWLDGDEGGLTTAERRDMAAHLDTCAACREALNQLEDTAALVAGLPPIEAPRTVQARARSMGRAHAGEMLQDAVLASSLPRAAARLSKIEVARSARVEEQPRAASPMRYEERPPARRVVRWVVIATASLVGLGLLAYALFG